MVCRLLLEHLERELVQYQIRSQYAVDLRTCVRPRQHRLSPRRFVPRIVHEMRVPGSNGTDHRRLEQLQGQLPFLGDADGSVRQ